jgi:hypothetical protein
VRDPRLAGTTAFVLLAALVTGCGSKSSPTNPYLRDVSGVVVKGQVLQNGRPLKVSKDEVIHVAFISTTDKQVASPSEFKPEDASFVVKGPTGKGLPAGKYKISIASDRYDGGENRFQEVFDAAVTPLSAEVGTEEGQTFVIDIATRSVTKK